MRFKIEVTQNMIKKGKQGDNKNDAISLAIKKYFKKKKIILGDLRVGSNTFFIVIFPKYDLAKSFYGYHSEKCKKFIVNFDIDKKLVKPCSFIMICNP